MEPDFLFTPVRTYHNLVPLLPCTSLYNVKILKILTNSRKFCQSESLSCPVQAPSKKYNRIAVDV